LYDGYRIEPVKWKYGMNTSKASNEILIFSKDNGEDPDKATND
jgi:hypothetical protein